MTTLHNETPRPGLAPLPATSATITAQRRALRELPPDDPLEKADAARGFIGTIPDAEIRGAYDNLVWNLADQAVLDEPQAPDTVHPAHWRHARLNTLHGLFRVTERIYQVRGGVDEADVLTGWVKIFAPSGFMETAISENVMAGTATAQRLRKNPTPATPRFEVLHHRRSFARHPHTAVT